MHYRLLLWSLLFLTLAPGSHGLNSTLSYEDFLKLIEHYRMNKTATAHIATIRRSIFKDYDKRAKPVQHRNGPLEVGIFVNLMSLHKMSYRDHSLHVQARLAVIWQDDSLQWVPSANGGVHTIRIDKDEIYRPDVTSYESMSSSNTFAETAHRDVVLFSNGILVWYPMVWVHTRCEVNLADWPFDQFNCSLLLGSWLQANNGLKVRSLGDRMGEYGYTENSKWQLQANYCATEMEHFENETYSLVQCWVQVQHQPGPHRYLIYWPVAFALHMQLMSLWLDAQQWTRHHLNTLAFLTLLLETLFLAHYLGDSSFETPRIIRFLAQMTALSLATLFWSSLAVNLIQSTAFKLPQLVASITKPMEPWLVADSAQASAITSAEWSVSATTSTKSRQNVQMLSIVKLLDLLLFTLSLVLIFALWLCYF